MADEDEILRGVYPERSEGLRMTLETVILSEAKDLCAHRDRPFAEFTLSAVSRSPERSEGEGLSMTGPTLVVKIHYRPLRMCHTRSHYPEYFVKRPGADSAI